MKKRNNNGALSRWLVSSVCGAINEDSVSAHGYDGEEDTVCNHAGCGHVRTVQPPVDNEEQPPVDNEEQPPADGEESSSAEEEAEHSSSSAVSVHANCPYEFLKWVVFVLFLLVVLETIVLVCRN